MINHNKKNKLYKLCKKKYKIYKEELYFWKQN